MELSSMIRVRTNIPDLAAFGMPLGHPILQLHQLALQAEQLLEVFLAVFLLVRIAGAAVRQAGQRVVILDVEWSCNEEGRRAAGPPI